MDIPKFLKVGNIVKIQHWYGMVDDVCISDTNIMVLISSPKGVWRNHPAEWLKYHEGQIVEANQEDAIESIDIYIERISKMLHDVQHLKNTWSNHQQ